MGATDQHDAGLPAPVIAMVDALTSRRGALAPSARREILERARAVALGAEPGGHPDDALSAYLDKVTRFAYKVVDGDVERLREAGWSDDAIFEATLCAATGAGLARFERGLDLLSEMSRRGDHAT